jgi:hypothetical protein
MGGAMGGRMKKYMKKLGHEFIYSLPSSAEERRHFAGTPTNEKKGKVGKAHKLF